MLAIIISETGRLAIILAASLLLSAGLLINQRVNRPLSHALATMNTYRAASSLTILAIVLLTLSFIQNDFGLHTVWANSHTDLPDQFKLFNIIGSPQGSWLLWTGLTLTQLSHAITHLYRKNISLDTRWATLISFGFCLFAITAANPFYRIVPIAPDNGIDLNPLLQDPGFLIHPPCLYLGTSAIIVPFILATNHIQNYQTQVTYLSEYIHRWALWCWGWLTLGITLGSWWAYRELGWGGWWFWDPVENAALMPWLATTALIHASSARGDNRVWVFITSASALLTNILGVFITRSGILVSVHGFANDAHKGYLIGLIGMICFIGVISVLPKIRKKQLKLRSHIQPQSTLLAMTVIVAIGTLYPIGSAWWSKVPLVIGAGYFEQVLMPFTFLLLWSMGRQLFSQGIKPSYTLCMASLGLALTTHWYFSGHFGINQINQLIVVCILYASAAHHLVAVIRYSEKRSMYCAHLLIILIALAVVCNRYYERVGLFTTDNGRIDSNEWSIQVSKPSTSVGKNYQGEIYSLSLSSRNNQSLVLYPEIRTYYPRKMQKSVTAITSTLMGDHYANIHKGETGDLTIRVYFKPLQGLFWMFGCLLGMMGIIRSIKWNHIVCTKTA